MHKTQFTPKSPKARRPSTAGNRERKGEKMSAVTRFYQELVAAIRKRLGGAAQTVKLQLDEFGKRITVAFEDAMDNAGQVATEFKHTVDRLLKQYRTARYNLNASRIEFAS